MSDKVKISELPEATTVNNSDLIAIVQDGITKKVTANKIPGSPLSYTPENVINKKTSWNNPTTDVNYPSEKLVKTELDTKSNIGHTHSEYALVQHGHPAADIIFNNIYACDVEEALVTLFGMNVPPWVAQEWPAHYLVSYNGGFYYSNDVTTAEHIPGISTRWDRILFMTAIEVRNLLQTLTVVNMLPATNVVYDPTGGKTVTAKINDLVTEINKKQDQLYSERFIVPNTGGEPLSTYTIEGKLIYPITLYVNKVPYFGKFCLPEDVGIYDFSYRHVSNNTIITSNQLASPPLAFNTNDIIDIVHSKTPVVPISPES